MLNNIHFTKPSWWHKIPGIRSTEPTLEDLRPTFIGYLRVIKFYHRLYHTKPGHYVITPQGIGEILEIISPELRDVNEYQYLIKLLDNVTVFFDEHRLKYLAVQPIDFYDNKLPILLSFAHYLYANPRGITEGTYTFKITKRGYAEMTKKTIDRLEINKLLTKYKGGRSLLKVMSKHNYIIIKKGETHHVKRRKHHL